MTPMCKLTVSAGSLAKTRKIYYCLENCQENFITNVEKEVTSERISLRSEEIPIHTFVNSALRNGNYHINEWFSKKLLNEKLPIRLLESMWMVAGDYIGYEQLNPYLLKRITKKGLNVRAETLKNVGRFEETARLYEHLKMYNEGGKTRTQDKQVTVKRTDITVNLNSLLKQIADGGIVAVYRCPHCSGKLKVSGKTSVDALRVCDHCGSEIEAMQLADFLKTALS